MGSKILTSAFVLTLLSLVCVDASAQQIEKPLFVIQAPKVDQSQYRSGYNASVSRASFAASQDEDDDIDEESTREPELSDSDDLLDDVSNSVSMPETEWNLKPMSSIAPRIRTTSGKVPEDRSARLTNLATVPLASTSKVFAWAAPNINYEPLFFEDVALERYGQTKGLFRQPFASAVEYLKSATLLPYKSIYDPIDSCDHPLGYARPGDCVDCVKQKHFFGNPFKARRSQ